MHKQIGDMVDVQFKGTITSIKTSIMGDGMVYDIKTPAGYVFGVPVQLCVSVEVPASEA